MYPYKCLSTVEYVSYLIYRRISRVAVGVIWLHLFIHWMHTCILYLIPLHKIFEHHSNWLAEREWYVCECVRVRFVPLASSGVSRYISSVWKPICSCWYWFLLGWLVSADAFLSQIHHHERQFVENSIKYWRWHKKGDSMKQNYNESRTRAKKNTHTSSCQSAKKMVKHENLVVAMRSNVSIKINIMALI